MLQPKVSYKRHRYPSSVIAHAVWLYIRFPLSLRLVEEMLLERGIVVSYETIRCWAKKFGPDYAGLGRERKTLIAERVFHVNRIKGLLFTQGIRDYQPVNRDRRQRLEELRTGDGRPLSKHLKGEICRELDRLELLLTQIKAVEAERDALIVQETPETPKEATALLGIKGIGPEFATILYTEGLFRHFDNRRQIASYAGLAPSPWQSGNVNRE